MSLSGKHRENKPTKKLIGHVSCWYSPVFWLKLEVSEALSF